MIKTSIIKTDNGHTVQFWIGHQGFYLQETEADEERTSYVRAQWFEKQLLTALNTLQPIIGATGKFPEGKLNKDDDGELQLAVGTHEKNVIIDFGKSTAWLGMPKEQAVQFAASIIKQANSIS